MKAVLVGLGGIGAVHLNAYKNIKNIELVAVCDVRSNIIKEKTEKMDIR